MIEESGKDILKKILPSKHSRLSTDTLLYDKVQPQARDLEEAILGAMLLDKDAVSVVVEVLKPESFYVDAHKTIYGSIQELFAKANPVDILTVTEHLRKIGKLDEIGGAYYLIQLTNRLGSSANVEHYARIVAEKYILRELISTATDITKEAYDETTDVFELLDKTEQSLFGITDNNLNRKVQDMPSLVNAAIKQIESLKDKKEGLVGIPSGFYELDRITSGWQKTDLIIVAARPAMGKTAFVLSLARNAAVEFKKPVAVFSLEMSSLQLTNRLISSEAEIPAEKIKKGQLEAYEWQQLLSKADKLTEAPIYIDDTPAINIFELRAKCRRLKMHHKIEMIVIDYLQLMSGTGDKRNGNREQEVSNISRSLKSIAKELEVPVIALSQLSRAPETRSGSKRPQLSDLRESGSIEQDADMVLFLYRPEYYGLDVDEEGNPTQGIAEVIISKHRNGAVGTVRTQFINQFAKFADLQQGSDFGNTTETEHITRSSSMNKLKSLPKGFDIQAEDFDDDHPFN
ncbi:MAG: replicative DNA helicase [Chitinophagales bacterium]|nr:replicative DNA helicase [Bacteroidota bacterium]MCB9043264.1 replicative DNA helicase [Chitinophagales bacterium]